MWMPSNYSGCHTLLKNNQKTEVRARISNDIVLYEPSEEQITKLKELIKEDNNNETT